MRQLPLAVLIAVNNRIFMVYYSPSKCYQFSILDEYGCSFDLTEVFYTSQAAETEAIKAINTLLVIEAEHNLE